MAGLVAAGAILVIYTALNWVVGRAAAWQRRVYLAPAWWRVWLLCALPLFVGIPAITMTVNTPTLPFDLAIACVAATLAGLALALWPGAWAAQRPRDLLWLAGDGMGLMPVLLLLRAVELPGRGVSVSVSLAWAFALGGILAGVAWLGLMTGLRVWRRTPIPSACELMAAGLSLSYLLLPLVHHLLATPPAYRYISAASNFFAFDLGVQIVALLVAAALAVTATWVRRHLRVTTVAGQIR